MKPLKTTLLLCLFFVLNKATAQQTHLLPAAGQYNPERTKKHDLIHTKLELKPDWTKQYLYGTATLRLKPHFYEQNTLELNAKGFEIQSVSMHNQALKYRYDKKILAIELGKTFSRKDTFQVEISYIAKPNELELHGSDAITSDKGLYFINPTGKKANEPRQIWTQGETESSSCWFPTLDSPNEKSTEEITLTVDNQYVTLSNGLLISSKKNTDGTRTDTWKQNKPHAPYLFMFAVGEFKKVVDSTFKDFEVSYYVEPKFEKYAYQIFGRTPEMIRYFSQILGVKFQWDKYAQIPVREYVSGAMENTTATIHGDIIQKNEHQLIDNNDDGTIAHELFHHWFGDLVTCESWSNLPLNESFANYSEYLWISHKYGEDEGDAVAQNDMSQYLAEAESKHEPLIRYHYLDREDMFDATSYSKGGRILHLLRKTVGDEAFFASLNKYLNKHKFGTAEVADLRLAFEEVTGEDMHWFFDQWFMHAGHPELDVKQSFQDGKIVLKIKQMQDTLTTPIYRLPMKLSVWVNNAKQDYDFTLNKTDETFTFPAAAKPNLVLLDPAKILVGTIHQEKTKDELVFQYQHTERYPARLEALTQLLAADTSISHKDPLADKQIRQLVLDATKDTFWKIRQFAVNQLNNYDGEGFLEVEKALQNRVQFDKRSLVRSDAILAMTNFQSAADVALFRQSLHDTSYTVQAAALEALLKNKVEDSPRLAAQFENTDNPDIFAAVANYYAEEANPNRFDWFQTEIQKLPEGDLYRVLGTYGTYLVKSSPEIQLKSLPLLQNIAKNAQMWYLRFMGTQTLALMASGNEPQNVAVKAILKDIALHETNPRLQKAYVKLKDL